MPCSSQASPSSTLTPASVRICRDLVLLVRLDVVVAENGGDRDPQRRELTRQDPRFFRQAVVGEIAGYQQDVGRLGYLGEERLKAPCDVFVQCRSASAAIRTVPAMAHPLFKSHSTAREKSRTVELAVSSVVQVACAASLCRRARLSLDCRADPTLRSHRRGRPRDPPVYITVLSGDGFVVDEAHNGFQALEKAIELLPDLVLTDIAVPGLDGIELCRRLRADARTRTVPVLAVTGYESTLPGPRSPSRRQSRPDQTAGG